jgi:hypothetical protein
MHQAKKLSSLLVCLHGVGSANFGTLAQLMHQASDFFLSKPANRCISKVGKGTSLVSRYSSTLRKAMFSGRLKSDWLAYNFAMSKSGQENG